MTHTNEQLEAALRKATHAALSMRSEVERERARAYAPLAIVGAGFRLPGRANDLDSLWRVLASGQDTVREIPVERFDFAGEYDADPDHLGTSYVRHAALIDDVDGFDANLFGITPREAEAMDPQHRLLLESSWAALEDAGYDPQALRESNTGLFVAIGPNEYDAHRARPAAVADAHAITGGHTSFAAGRIAYHLGLQGPALAIDTACSSSLVALHLAAAHLRTGRCDLALVGGVQVIADPETFVHLSRTRAVAPDGRSKTFSDRADGYGRGEGVVVFAVMRLDDAKTQKRRVLGVVRGTAVNHDGASASITAPNGSAQQKVLRAALEDAQLSSADVDVVECHGTGTSLGDPIEVRALHEVYGRARPSDLGPLLLGAVKTNLGHLESAAGAVGVLKVLASFAHEALPPTLHTQPRNAHLEWDQLNVRVVDALTPWARAVRHVRRAAVSSFGLSGTNAHVILEEPPRLEPEPRSDGRARPALRLAVLSAQSDAALAEAAGKLPHALSELPCLDDLSHALWTTRARLPRRLVVPVLRSDAEAGYPELCAALQAFAKDAALTRGARLTPRDASPGELAVLFTGQGSQRPDMGRGLYGQPGLEAFSAALDALTDALERHLPRSLRSVMWDAGDAHIHSTRYTQPALFALEVALFRQWQAWGLRPAYVIGHSVGELAAAHVAGVIELGDAARMVCARAQLMDELAIAGGSMVSIQADEREVREALDELELVASLSGFSNIAAGVSIASLNGPSQTVISGDVQLVRAVVACLEVRGRKCKPLRVSHAFHSPHIEPMLKEFEEICAGTTFMAPSVPVISNLTGEVADPTRGELVSARYWVDQVRGTVRFHDGVRAALARGVRTFVECGPDGVLSALVRQCAGEEARAYGSLAKEKAELTALGSALAGLCADGVALDWSSLLASPSARPITLPSYAFQRRSYWREPAPAQAPVVSNEPALWPLAGRRMPLTNGDFVHLLELGPAVQAYLADHLVYDTVVIPGAFYLSVFLAVAAEHFPERDLELTNVEFQRALTFASTSDRITAQVHLRAGPDGVLDATLAAQRDGVWTTHATARLGAAHGLEAQVVRLPGAQLEQAPDGLLERLEAMRVSWGPRWQWLEGSSALAEQTFARMRAPAGTPSDDAPMAGALLDASFAVLLDTTFAGRAVADGVPFLPFGVERFRCRADATTARWVRCTPGNVAESLLVGDLAWFDERGGLVAQMEGFTAHRAPAERFLGASAEERDLFVVGLRELPASFAAEPVTPTRLTVNTLDDLRDGLPFAPHVAVEVRLAENVDARSTVIRFLGALQQAVRRSNGTRLARLTMCVRGALRTSARDRAPHEAHAALWSLLRTLRLEKPELALCLVDEDGSVGAPPALSHWYGAGEFAVRDGRLMQPELRKRVADGERLAAPALSDSTVLITGGTGGLGAVLAAHLVRQHRARHVLLASRSGSDAPGTAQLVAELRALGASSVRVARCDVSVRAEVATLLAEIPHAQPLGAVIHTAGVLRDAPFDTLGEAAIHEVFAPKLDAAHHLDALTRELPSVRAFVLFSSLAGLIGNAGQAAYAAANAALDALAARRHDAGHPATSLAWGPWADVGMAAELRPHERARLASNGIELLPTRAALAAFDAAWTSAEPVLAVARFDAAAVGERHPYRESMLAPLLGRRARPQPASAGAREQLARLPASDRRAAIVDIVRTEIAYLLGLPGASDVAAEKPLQQIGVDSLLSVDLRHRLSARFAATLPATLAFDYPTSDALAGFLHAELFSAQEPLWSEGDIRAKLQRAPIHMLRALAGLDALLAAVEDEPQSAPAAQGQMSDAIRSAEDRSLLELAESMLGSHS